MNSESLDCWREYFGRNNLDIFEIIEKAIIVAANDCPKEFACRRDGIAELLFSTKLTHCSRCNYVEISLPKKAQNIKAHFNDNHNGGDDDDKDIDIGDRYEFDSGVRSSKESKVMSNNGEVNVNESNYRYGEAEALTNEIEEQSQVVGEVMRIKDLFTSQDESDSVLFDSLKKLQWMTLSVDILKATEIGKAVNGLRKHGSEKIRHLANTLIDEWKDLVDEWYNTTKSMKGDEETPEYVNPSVLNEEGLPSPPLDMEFFATQQTGMELSQIFNGMDDDGNPQNGGKFIKNCEPERKPLLEHCNVAKRKQQMPCKTTNVLTIDKNQLVKRQEHVLKTSRTLSTDFSSCRPLKHIVERKSNNNLKLQQTYKVVRQIKPSVQKNKPKSPDESSVQMKLKATKRKLQESYQRAESAKRQRTIQVMELHDLPKQGLSHKNSHMHPKKSNRHWAHAR